MQDNKFGRGLVIGSVLGMTIGMIYSQDKRMRKTNKRIMKSGRNMLRRSGTIVEDVMDLFR